ncbi:MAG: hypothetical protein OXH13_12405 [Chloroflexi bacterium]|nr:hypothetical protein [Chloroflexota bacterium]MCY3695736.1 hypothetical protein [Chloroflexota bacterium]
MASYETAEAAYWAFLETFNARDAAGWAGVNSWPHARVSAAAPESAAHWRPPTRVFADAEEYLAEPLWADLEATGWVRSESLPPTVVQASNDKAHIAGGWTRYDTDDEPMAANRVVYVMTRSGKGWGIQAQLKTDSFADGVDFSSQERAAVSAVEATLALLDAGEIEAYCEALSYPFTLVGPPGIIIKIDTAEEMASAMRGVGDDRINAPPGTARVVNCGRSGANVTFRVERDGVPQRALALVGLRDGAWRMLAISGI